MMNLEKKCSAYLTVYLSLTLSILLSLVLVLVEGIRRNTVRVETECVMEIGMDSILAEYNRELLEQFNLFAIDCSYGTKEAFGENMTQHLQNYLNRNFSTEDVFLQDFFYRDFLGIRLEDTKLTAGRLLTDDGGSVFRKATEDAVKDDSYLNLFAEIGEWIQVLEEKGMLSSDLDDRRMEADRNLQQKWTENMEQNPEQDMVSFESPVKELDEVQRKGILSFVVDDVERLSTKAIQKESLVGYRLENNQCRKGNWQTGGVGEEETAWDEFLFLQYLLTYLGHYGNEKEEGAAAYQIEYLIGGNSADMDNLKAVVHRICLIREAANMMYLVGDEEKCGEAELMATLIALAVQQPELIDPLKAVILLGWAYGESLYDVKTLLAGGRIPLLKEKESWHYSLEKALQPSREEIPDAQKTGMSYTDYLTILLLLAGRETVTSRAMDMVEADIRLTPGNENFRLDACYDGVEYQVNIQSSHGYAYQITRQKIYGH